MEVKKCVIIISIAIILITLFSMQYSITYASFASEVIGGSDDFISDGESKINPNNIKNLSNDIYNILLIIGIVIAVIVGAILGIQFMTGSVEQKSKIKEALIPYFVGTGVIFGAFGIWKIAIILLGSLS